MTEFKLTRKNNNSPSFVQVEREAIPVAMLAIAPLGTSDRQDREALAVWLRNACVQYVAVNPDDPFPFPSVLKWPWRLAVKLAEWARGIADRMVDKLWSN